MPHDMTILELASELYAGYGDEAGWKTWDGKPMPRWDELPAEPDIKARWIAAARRGLRCLHITEVGVDVQRPSDPPPDSTP